MHFLLGESLTEGTAVRIEENTADNDFLLAVLLGIIFRQKMFTIAEVYILVKSVRTESKCFWQAFTKWKSVISADKTQSMFDHRRPDLDSRLAQCSSKTKTKTKTQQFQDQDQGQDQDFDIQDQYWKSMTGMDCDKQKD